MAREDKACLGIEQARIGRDLGERVRDRHRLVRDAVVVDARADDHRPGVGQPQLVRGEDRVVLSLREAVGDRAWRGVRHDRVREIVVGREHVAIGARCAVRVEVALAREIRHIRADHERVAQTADRSRHHRCRDVLNAPQIHRVGTRARGGAARREERRGRSIVVEQIGQARRIAAHPRGRVLPAIDADARVVRQRQHVRAPDDGASS